MKKELTTIQRAELLGLGYSGGYTIGDLIEFLGGKEDFNSLKRAHELWIEADNYCDALYEAVKEKLKK